MLAIIFNVPMAGQVDPSTVELDFVQFSFKDQVSVVELRCSAIPD